MLNTAMAVLAAVVVVVVLDCFLFFGCYLPRNTMPLSSPPRAECTTSLEKTTVERTRPTYDVEQAQPKEICYKERQPRKTSEQMTTSSATATASPESKARTTQ
jgi:hypothetical protein